MTVHHSPEALHALSAYAPTAPTNILPGRVMFPFSNDDSIDSFKQALSRVETDEYAGTKNPVAVLIGESALSTQIHTIPEPTIILLDNEAQMAHHMASYVEALEMSPTPTTWAWNIGIGNNAVLSPQVQNRYRRQLAEQMQWWEHNETPHALADLDVYRSSQEKLTQKAIIPWTGDITSRSDMEALGTALRKLDATVTLLNISNVIPFSASASSELPEIRSFPTAAGYADVLAELPMLENTPILTTSRKRVSSSDIVASTGPFYGLDQLREGGDSLTGPVAVNTKRQAPRQRVGNSEVDDLLADLLRRALGS